MSDRCINAKFTLNDFQVHVQLKRHKRTFRVNRLDLKYPVIKINQLDLSAEFKMLDCVNSKLSLFHVYANLEALKSKNK